MKTRKPLSAAGRDALAAVSNAPSVPVDDTEALKGKLGPHARDAAQARLLAKVRARKPADPSPAVPKKRGPAAVVREDKAAARAAIAAGSGIVADAVRKASRKTGAVAGPPLSDDQAARLLEVADGVPILKKSPPAPPDPSVLHTGQLVRGAGGTAWEVVGEHAGSVDVKCVRGPRTGTTEVWSTSAAGHKFMTREQLDSEKLTSAKTRAGDGDETRCPNCWGGDGIVDGVDRGREPGCKNHQVAAAAVERALHGVVSRKRKVDDPADVAKVLELRATGLGYAAIEKALGWPDTKGGRPWRIVKATGGTGTRAKVGAVPPLTPAQTEKVKRDVGKSLAKGAAVVGAKGRKS